MSRQICKRNQGFTLLDLIVCISLIGLLVAVSLPTFIRYVRRSRTVEAVMNTRKLTESALAYYMSEHADGTGAILQRQLPACMAPYYPALGTCCGLPGRACAPKPDYWKDPSMVALNFSLDERFHYSYTADSASTKWGRVGYAFNGVRVANCAQPGQPGETMAYGGVGDLNCNGVYSVFLRTVTVDETYTAHASSALLTHNELE